MLVEKFEKSDIPYVAIAISNVCNLNCPMCCSQDSKVKHGYMTFDLFKRSVDKVKEMGINLVTLHNVNEPILHPEIFKFLNYLEDKNLGVWLSTNGRDIDKFIAKAKKQIRLPKKIELRFSIDGGSKAVYEEMRKGASFEKLLINLELMDEFSRGREFKYIKKCAYILTKKTLKEVATFYDRFKAYFQIEDISFNFLDGNSTTGLNDFIIENAPTKLVRRLPCYVPFKMMNIHYDGKVSICCTDFNREGIVGDIIKDQSCLDIWNGKIMQEYRKAFNNAEINCLPSLCQRCYYSSLTAYLPEINKNIKKLLTDTSMSVVDKDKNIETYIVDFISQKEGASS